VDFGKDKPDPEAGGLTQIKEDFIPAIYGNALSRMMAVQSGT